MSISNSLVMFNYKADLFSINYSILFLMKSFHFFLVLNTFPMKKNRFLIKLIIELIVINFFEKM